MLVAEVSAIAQGKICLVAAPLAPPCPTTVIPLVGAVVVARMRLVVPPAGVAPSESPRTKSVAALNEARVPVPAVVMRRLALLLSNEMTLWAMLMEIFWLLASASFTAVVAWPISSK